MANSKHTPLPKLKFDAEVFNNSHHADKCGSIVTDDEHEWIIAEVCADQPFKDVRQQIVQRCNSHDKLVGALKTLNGILENAPELNMSNYDHDQVAVLNSAMVEACLFCRDALREAGEL